MVEIEIAGHELARPLPALFAQAVLIECAGTLRRVIEFHLVSSSAQFVIATPFASPTHCKPLRGSPQVILGDDLLTFSRHFPARRADRDVRLGTSGFFRTAGDDTSDKYVPTVYRE